ncbi:hypothetical protein C1940_00080 [Lactiplantibacillus plantarum subsp. plantarum]|uniref:HK97-gp10 family putative phage morphogenesis protein n=1 Tax=Lactiplantibacillus plantarum TaxID=1590 RepID=UPI000CD34B75|nr:HK97-gp10 family putative phage morphogenesis protein [Lactiplantibacillus plantarum]AUV70959.1 hypothetical protein C1940_00080 [Lactiplantibacillus plantarum subsp. plantarum]
MANSDFDVSFKGIKDLFDDLNISQEKAVEYSKAAMKSSLSRAVERSQREARVDTGYMRRNIIADPVEEAHGVVTGRYVARAVYSSFNEYGTYKMSAQPFMRPGVKAETPFFYKAVKDALKKAGEMPSN